MMSRSGVPTGWRSATGCPATRRSAHSRRGGQVPVHSKHHTSQRRQVPLQHNGERQGEENPPGAQLMISACYHKES
jgi:hypothetical protein